MRTTEQRNWPPSCDKSAERARTERTEDEPAVGWNIENREHIATVLDLLTEGFVLFDENQRFVFCNETYKTYYTKLIDLLVPGTPRSVILEAAVSRGQLSTLETEGRDYVAERISFEGTEGKVHDQQLCDGRWLRVSERRLSNGWVLGTRTDITEARQREAAVARTEQLLVDAVDTLQEGFALFDKDDRLVVCNDKYKSYFPIVLHLIEPGVKFEELIRNAAERGQNVESVKDPNAWIEARLQAHAQAEGTFAHKFSDGRHVWVTERKTREGGTVSTYVDITRLKLREEELERARVEAEAANNAKSEFLATMSHEIRTPMNGVMGMLGLLLESELDDEQQSLAQTANDSANGLMTILNDILDYSKLEAGRVDLEMTDLNPAEEVANVRRLLAERASDKGLDFSYEISPEVPEWLIGDPTRLRQVLINLVGNAIKFTDLGEVRIEASASRLDEHHAEIRFAVHDTGIGIPQEALDRLFNRFEQVDSSMTRKFGGTGLGLSISKQLTEMMGGSIGVDSAPGTGSTFWFTIRCPVGESPKDEPLKETAEPAAPTRPLHILVAEDNEINQAVVTMMLGRRGHSFDVANDGAEAVAAVKRRSYDIVLMDIQMPEMDGTTATREIRQLEGPAARVPIIALTANAMTGNRESYLAAGMDDYVAKPVKVEALFEAIARHANVEPASDEPGNADIGIAPPAESPDDTPRNGSGSNDNSPYDEDRLRELESAANADFLEQMMAKIPDNARSLLNDIQTALAAGDLAAAQACAHTLKGTAHNFGLLDIAEHAAAIYNGEPVAQAFTEHATNLEAAVCRLERWHEKRASG